MTKMIKSIRSKLRKNDSLVAMVVIIKTYAGTSQRSIKLIIQELHLGVITIVKKFFE